MNVKSLENIVLSIRDAMKKAGEDTNQIGIGESAAFVTLPVNDVLELMDSYNDLFRSYTELYDVIKAEYSQ